MEPSSFSITVEPHGATTALGYRSGVTADAPCLVLAHGAGAGQRHPFMVATARALADRGVDVVTFDFLYTAAGRRSPDRPPVLEATWRAVLAGVVTRGWPRRPRIVIGGKSMGGRIASQLLGASDPSPLAPGDGDGRRLEDGTPAFPSVSGLVLLGYPLHPPGQPEKLRTAHLPALRTPTLVVQGSRDEFGGEDEVRAAFAVVPAPVDWHIVAGGDHSFKVTRTAGRQAEVLRDTYDAVGTWIKRVTA